MAVAALRFWSDPRLARPGRQQRRHVHRWEPARSGVSPRMATQKCVSCRCNDLGLLFPARPQPPGPAGQASTSIRPGSWRCRVRGPLADTEAARQPGQIHRPVSDGLEKSTFFRLLPPDSSRSRRLHAEADPQPTAACGCVATVCRRSCLCCLPPRSRIKNEAANELGMSFTDDWIFGCYGRGEAKRSGTNVALVRTANRRAGLVLVGWPATRSHIVNLPGFPARGRQLYLSQSDQDQVAHMLPECLSEGSV